MTKPMPRAVASALALSLAAAAHAQAPTPDCPAPAPSRLNEPILFDTASARTFGDLIAEQGQSSLRIMEDPALTAELTRIGDRVRAYIPNPTGETQYLLLDEPVATAFGIIGGRVFVTRRMIAFVKTEDELAAILAHELAHQANRDAEVRLSRRLRALGVTKLGDRDDVADKYHLLLDSALDPVRTRNDEETEQIEADRLAIHALRRAGYQSSALGEAFDRFVDARGRTGSWLSNILGATRPDSKRLREAMRAQPALPPSCISTAPVDAAAFARWRAAVAAFDPGKDAGDPPGLIFKKALESPLQPTVDRLRFSPDGRHILAHDSSGITVFDREPFAATFRIDTEDAVGPDFTPDSTSIVFHTAALRVEKWDLASHERVSQSEIVRGRPCTATRLSPDGSLFACYTNDGVVLLLDSASGVEIFRKTGYAFDFSSGFAAGFRSGSFTHLQFSPDGRYFLAWVTGRDPVGYDLRAKAVVSIGGSIRELLRTGFGAGFLGPDRLAGIDEHLGRARLSVVKFPDGSKISRTPLTMSGVITAPASGDTLQMRPAGKYPVAVIDPETGTLMAASLASALDTHKDTAVLEVGDGQIELRRFKPGAESVHIASTHLLPGPLGTVTASAVSPDLKWFALSQEQRGAVWNLETGKRVAQLHEFQAALLDAQPPALHADFPASRDQPRTFATLDLLAAKITATQAVKDLLAVQIGPSIITTLRDTNNPLQIGGIEVSDARTHVKLWSRSGGKGTGVVLRSEGGDLVIAWPANIPENKTELSRSPLLSSRLAEARGTDGELLLEIAAAKTGEVLGAVLHRGPAGGGSIQRVYSIGGTLVIEDPQGRVFLYSIADGRRMQRMFATRSTLSPSGRRLAAQNRPGRIAIYDVASARKEREITLPRPAALATFADERRLLVVTLDQAAYLVDVAPESSQAPPTPPAPARLSARPARRH